MFIVSAKINRKTRVIAALCLLALIVGIILSVTLPSGGDNAAPTSTGTAAGERIPKSAYKGIKTDADRRAFLAQLGWETAEDASTIEEVVIPEEFDAVYNSYNQLQAEQNLDLSKYKGKTVKRYTYQITNYEGADSTVYANLLIYKNRIIGGDICSSEYGGFMHGFRKP